jgi:tetratricopeptide (TPR) repeat protein
MRPFLAFLCCLLLPPGEITQLQELREKGLFFQLREALEQPGWKDGETLFYRAVVENRFGRESAAIGDLQKFLASRPQPPLQRTAEEELAAAFLRAGRYGDSARALGEALRATPADDADRADTENSQELYQALSDVPPQSIEFGESTPLQASRNALGSWDVPVEANGRAGEWIFDTGANLSTLTESEAARLGLATRETQTFVNGSTGKRNPLRLAVAPDLRLGGAHLKNVVFLVLSDESLYVAPLKYQIRGILGLPVLQALGCVGISAKGEVRIEPQARPAAGPPNLFFDGEDLIVDVRHGEHRLQIFLDTGANASFVYPSFRSALTREERAALKSKQDTTGGAGGVVTRMAEAIPSLRLEILDRSVELKDVSMLSKPAAGKTARDGVLGMDGLQGGFTLDFRRMRLSLN